jgi:hypothetical protein
MASEQQIRLAAKLYEMRDGAKHILGNRYHERMNEFAEAIRIVQQRRKLDILNAALDICQHVEAGGFEVVFVMAAACEMLEPTQVQHTAPQGET